MKRFFAFLLTTLGIAASAQSPKAAPANPVAELRAMALRVKPADLGLRDADFTSKPWGVLMETGLDTGDVWSLVVLADGTTSLYFSNGGGILGSGAHESVRSVGLALLEVVARNQAKLKPTPATPLPKPGMVRFYALTSKGILTYSANEQALGYDRDQLSELFHAGHAVIWQVRAVEEAQAKAQTR